MGEGGKHTNIPTRCYCGSNTPWAGGLANFAAVEGPFAAVEGTFAAVEGPLKGPFSKVRLPI